MNIVEQGILEDVLRNPQTEREQVLCLALLESGGELDRLHEILNDPFSPDYELSDPENEKTLHQYVQDAQSDLITTRKTVAKVLDLLGERIKVVEDDVNGGFLEDDWMSDIQEALLLLGGLEEDGECLCGSALTYAIGILGTYNEIDNFAGGV